MKNIKDILDAVVKPIKLGGSSLFSNFLTEESDYEGSKILTEEDDPFAAGHHSSVYPASQVWNR